jgi:hypothetical protein
VLATFKTLPSPLQYPQYRKELCAATGRNGLGLADWVALGQAVSSGLIQMEKKNTLGHDVGFVNFPFVEELAM